MAVVHKIEMVNGVRTFYGVGYPTGYFGEQLLKGYQYVDKITGNTYEFGNEKWHAYIAGVAPAGKSAYELWLGLGNKGSEGDFIASLKGKAGEITTKTVTKSITLPGAPGASAYEVWMSNGHVGSEADFLASLKGADGAIPDTASFELKANKGVGNGYCELDGNGQVPLIRINDAIFGNCIYQTNWNPATDTPGLPAPSAGNKGWYWVCSEDGTYSGIAFVAGDWIISDGFYYAKVPNVDAVKSVNGYIGIVNLITSDIDENADYRYCTDAEKAVINNTSGTNTGDLKTLTIPVIASTLATPVKNTNYYFKNLIQAPSSNANGAPIYFRKAGKISIAEISAYCGGAGTNENWSMWIRVNNTTDYLIATVGSATNLRYWSNIALSISVNAGDYFEIKSTCPNWVTAPTSVLFTGYVLLEY